MDPALEQELRELTALETIEAEAHRMVVEKKGLITMAHCPIQPGTETVVPQTAYVHAGLDGEGCGHQG